VLLTSSLVVRTRTASGRPRGRALPRVLLASALAAVLAAPAAPAAADVGVVWNSSESLPARTAAQLAVETALDHFGIPHRRVEERRLTERQLRSFTVVVLPGTTVDERGLLALEQFSGRDGGRWVAYAVSATAAAEKGVHELMGLKALPMVPDASPRALIPDARPGMPGRVPIANGSALQPVAATDDGYNAGRWDVSTAAAALVRGPKGYYVNLLPDPQPEEEQLLLAMLGDLDSSVWAEALTYSSKRARDAIQMTCERWSKALLRPEFTSEQRARINAGLQSQKGLLPPAEIPSPDVESNRTLIAERVEAAIHVQMEVRRLSYQMTPPRKGEVRGIWIHPSAPQDWDAVMKKVRDAGLNTVFVRVGQGGTTIYRSEVLPTSQWAAGGADQLAAAIAAARKYGLAFHAWRIAYNLESAPRAYFEKMKADGRVIEDPDGNPGMWLNPGDPRNIEQELKAIVELVKSYNIDGFHFDYIRYPDTPHYDWDYGKVSRHEFEAASGKVVANWPDDVISGSRKLEYEAWERGNINQLVQRAYKAIKDLKPQVQVSAAVWRNRHWSRAAIKQDWLRWVTSGWVDFVVPMDYSSAPDVVAQSVRAQVAAAHGFAPVVAGIGAWQLKDPMSLLLQVEAARDAGADGFVLFSYSDPDIDEQLAALRAGATSEGTWPAYLAPRAEWQLGPFVLEDDSPLNYVFGQPTTINVKILPRGGQHDEFLLIGSSAPWGIAITSLAGDVRLEDPSGNLISTIGVLYSKEGRLRSAQRIEVPAGLFRPVVRGTVTLADKDKSVRPFVIRGPLCNGIAAEEREALLAQGVPPAVGGAGRKVGVYMGAVGARTVVEKINAPGSAISAFPLWRLQPDFLARADAIVLPPLEDVSELSQDVQQALRDWVNRGGTLLLLGDAVGAHWHPRMFPEIGVGGETEAQSSLVLAQGVGSLNVGDLLEQTGASHVRIKPAKSAEVLLREPGADGAAVAVRGKVGRGRVIMYGALPAASRSGTGDEERALLWSWVGAGR